MSRKTIAFWAMLISLYILANCIEKNLQEPQELELAKNISYNTGVRKNLHAFCRNIFSDLELVELSERLLILAVKQRRFQAIIAL